MLGDSLRQNPDSFFVGQPEGFEKLYAGRYAYASVITKVVNVQILFTCYFVSVLCLDQELIE